MKHHKAAYKFHKMLIYNAMLEFGFDNFVIEALEEVSDSELFDREVYWISQLNTLTPNGYNATIGGQALFGENNPFYGKSHSTETLKRLSEIRIGVYVGENNPFYGKSHSDETKQLISIKNKGRKDSEATKALKKLNNSGENNPFYGKSHSNETKKHLSRVHCTKNISMYDSNYNFICTFETMRDVYDYIISNKLYLTSTKFKTISNTIHRCTSNHKMKFNHYWAI